MCKGICGLIKFIMYGVVFGTILGFIGIYLMENDRRFRHGAKKVCQKVENFTHDVKSKFGKHEHNCEHEPVIEQNL